MSKQKLQPIDPQPFLEEWNLALRASVSVNKKAQILEVVQETGEIAILKVYRYKSMGFEAESPHFLSAMDGEMCAKLLRSGPRALLLEHLEGKELVDLVKKGRDADATDIIIDIAEAVCAKRHSYTPPKSMTERFVTLLTMDHSQHPELKTEQFEQAFEITRMALHRDAQAERGMLHGDLHHANIIQGSSGWRAFDPITLFGEREAEYAQAFCNPSRSVEVVHDPLRALRMADQINARTGLEKGRLIAWGVAKAAHSLAVETNKADANQKVLALGAKRLSALLEAYNATAR
jgi:streptomycin 6-kinase